MYPCKFGFTLRKTRMKESCKARQINLDKVKNLTCCIFAHLLRRRNLPTAYEYQSRTKKKQKIINLVDINEKKL